MNERQPEHDVRPPELWNEGPNYAADPVVIVRSGDTHYVLLIRRSDTGGLALPGGFVDSGEHSSVSARRELKEETGLAVHKDGELLCHEMVDDHRNTAERWVESTAYGWYYADEAELPRITAGDDAVDALWYDVTQLPESGINTTHYVFIGRALELFGIEKALEP